MQLVYNLPIGSGCRGPYKEVPPEPQAILRYVCERGVFSRARSLSLSVRLCVSSCVCTCTFVRPFRKQDSVSVCAVGVCVCLWVRESVRVCACMFHLDEGTLVSTGRHTPIQWPRVPGVDAMGSRVHQEGYSFPAPEETWCWLAEAGVQ